jgi:endonuclease/exonuclease/phosphatase (EEP) superfamily protein YafD
LTISKFSTRDFALNRILALFAIPAALSLLALGARWHWLLDLLTHFRAHYLAVLVIAVVICLASRRFKLAAAVSGFVVLNLWFVAPLYFGNAVNDARGSLVRVMTANAFCANPQRDLLIRYISAAAPDVLLVMEIDGGWANRLEALSDAYPHRLIESRQEDCFGIALLSKLPVKQLEVRKIGPAGVPSIYAELSIGNGGTFHVVGSHPVPPNSAHWAEMHRRQLEDLGDAVAALDGPRILLGDLNTTSWSPYFRDLLTTADLRDSRRGFGNQTSWRSSLVQFGIAIDHMLVSPDIAVRNRFVGPDVGSDHRPVIADILMRRN